MAKFKGTNGNDTITGTAGDDTIVPLLGQDVVDGGAGYDTLTIDYSSLADAYWYSTMQLQADGSWTGGVTGGSSSAPNYVSFSNVERVKFTDTQANDYLTVDLGTLTPDKARLSLDGAGGDDTLSVLGGDLTKRLTLVTAADGKVKANFATLAGWEHYDIALGLSTGNTLVLGGGNDIVSSTGGQDTIDGGAGQDQWTGYYQAIADDLNFFFSTGTGVATVTAGSTQLAEVKNVESMSLQAGSGDDIVTAFGGAGSFNGGAGSDEIALNPWGAGAPMRYNLSVESTGHLAGSAVALSGGDPLVFRDYENIILGGSSGDDQFAVDGSQAVLANSGVGLDLRGGDGNDSLALDLRAQGAAAVLKGGADAGYIAGLGDLNVLSWTGIEALTVTFGAGDDFIQFNAASKSVSVDGGAGFDVLDFSGATSGAYFNFSDTGPQYNSGIAVSAVNVEGLVGTNYGDLFLDSAASETIQCGGGDDKVREIVVSSAGIDTFDGGTGSDTIDYSAVGASVYVSLAITTAQNTGGGGTDILTGFEKLTGSGYNDILTGSSGNDVLGGSYGDDILQGGAGDDMLYGGALGDHDTASYSAATAAVTVSLSVTTAQNTGGAGTDTLSGIAYLIGSAYNDALTGNADANRLTGGRGADTLTGLGGADVFVYTSKLDSSGSAYDTIADFSRAQGDRIDLQAIDAKDGINDPIRINDAFTWIGSDAFHGVAGELREIGARGGGYLLYGDTNGDKVADLTIFVNSATPVLSTDITL